MDQEENSKKEVDRQSFLSWLTSPQMIVSISAMILSICGLFVSIYETSLMREQQEIMKEEQYASVWPNVELGPSLDSGKENLKIVIRNTGIGPARVKGAAILHNDELVPNWASLVQKLTGRENYMTGNFNLIGGTVLPPQNNQDYIFNLETDSDTEKQLYYDMRNEIFEGRLDVKICYCSVYDECWTSSIQNTMDRYQGRNVLSNEEMRIESCSTFKSSGI